MGIDSNKFKIFSPITMQWRDGPFLNGAARGFNVGSDFYVRTRNTELWKFNVATMEFEYALRQWERPPFTVLAIVPVPESFTVCT